MNRRKDNYKGLKRDQFKRIKNKKETVYRMPDFLRKITGALEITQSGIVKHKGNRYTKIYWMDLRTVQSQIGEILIQLRKRDISYSVRTNGDVCELRLCDNVSQSMTQAQERLEQLEEELSQIKIVFNIEIKALTMTERIEAYLQRMNVMLNLPENESMVQKPGLFVSELCKVQKVVRTAIQTEKGFMGFVGIRALPYMIEPIKEREYDFLLSVYSDIRNVSDKAVRGYLLSNYVGLDGIDNRIMRHNSELHTILHQPTGSEDTKSFCVLSRYYQVYGENEEALNQNMKTLIHDLWEQGYRADIMYFQAQDLFQCFAGFKQDVINGGNLLPVSKLTELFTYERVTEDKTNYDELKEMFMS